MFEQFETHILPFLLDNGNLFAHFQFLLRGICDVFDFIFVVEKFQVPDGLNQKILIDGEFFFDYFDDFSPVSSVFD